MFYVISPPEPSGWRCERDHLVARLRWDWPTARLSAEDLSTRQLVWNVSTDDGDLEGSLDRAGTGVYLDGPVSAVAQFAAWWRTIVPTDQPLVLCDDGYEHVIDLVPDLSAAAIDSALS